MSGQASHILRPPVPNDGDALLSTTMASSDFADRKHKKLFLFDVDETLTPARRVRFKFHCPWHLMQQLKGVAFRVRHR